MKICEEKTKIMTNKVNDIQKEIGVKVQKLVSYQTSDRLEQLSDLTAQTPRFSQVSYKPMQLLKTEASLDG